MKPKSLGDAIAAYLSELADRKLSETHIRTVKHRLGRFARGRETVPLREAATELEVYFVGLRDTGLSNGTLAGHKSTHLAFWRWCASRRWCRADAADALRTRANRYSFRPVRSRAADAADFAAVVALRTRANRYSFRPVRSRAADAADFAAVVACLPAFAAHRGWMPRDVRDAALVSLFIDSGKRRGEILSLRRRAVEAALGRPGNTSTGRRVYHAATEDGKTGAVVVRFYEESADLLRRWLQHVPRDAGFVFINLRSGQPLQPDSLRIGLARACDFAGVPPFGFHAIRKRVVTSIIAATGDAKVGQRLAGHADERTTQAYYNDIQEEFVDAAAGELADRLRGRGDLLRGFFGTDETRRPL